MTETLKDRLVAAFLEQMKTNDPPEVRRSHAEAFATVAEDIFGYRKRTPNSSGKRVGWRGLLVVN